MKKGHLDSRQRIHDIKHRIGDSRNAQSLTSEDDGCRNMFDFVKGLLSAAVQKTELIGDMHDWHDSTGLINHMGSKTCVAYAKREGSSGPRPNGKIATNLPAPQKFLRVHQWG